jgi:hypothetical protein
LVVAVVLVLADEEREKLKLAFVERVRADCSELRETERCRFRASREAFLVCDGDRWGIMGGCCLEIEGLGFNADMAGLGTGACPGAVK